MDEKKVDGANSPTENDAKNLNGGDGIHPKNNGKTLLNIGQVKGIPYSKEGDNEGFLRLRIVGKTAIDGVICQVTGYVTQIREKNDMRGSTNPL